MNEELLKAWVHNVIQNPIDDDQLAHAQATKELIDKLAIIKAESIQKGTLLMELQKSNAELKLKLAKAKEALSAISSGDIAPSLIKEPYIDQAYQRMAKEALKDIE